MRHWIFHILFVIVLSWLIIWTQITYSAENACKFPEALGKIAAKSLAMGDDKEFIRIIDISNECSNPEFNDQFDKAYKKSIKTLFVANISKK